MQRAGITNQNATDFCREILPAVSRTFALSIRLLPGELGAAVRCAYLICRIADTIEDVPNMPAESKAALLDLLAACFDGARSVDAFGAAAQLVTGDPAHVRLVQNTDLVFAAYRSLPERTREIVERWIREMIAGMRKFVLAYPRGVRIQSLDEYKEYCYYVAGTVGHLLTDLWHEHSPSIGAGRYALLRERCRAFAEALQTVNILKDVARDAEHENSIYIPDQLLRRHGSDHATLVAGDRAGETRAALAEMIELAWRDLDEAKAYLLAIPRRAVSIRLFCALPLLFAYATLRDLTRTSDVPGPRAVVKISRSEVKSLTVLSVIGVLSNRAMDRLVERARRKPVLVVP
jgi:farnesyl-diphosphate farnesyltransferase